MFITCHAYIGAPRGVTVLEYELPEPEEQQGEPPQGAEDEDLPECPPPPVHLRWRQAPEHYKPPTILYHVELSIHYGYVLLH